MSYKVSMQMPMREEMRPIVNPEQPMLPLHQHQRSASHYASERYEDQVRVLSQCGGGVAVVRTKDTTCARRSWTWCTSGNGCSAVYADGRGRRGRKGRG